MTTMGIIFANIYDSSLGELTNKRTMASLPYGGRYRQIDFSLSNMTNSAIRHIGIITKYNYQSLMNHIGSGQEWDLELGEGGLEFLTPFAMGHNGSYRGKLEAAADALLREGSDLVYIHVEAPDECGHRGELMNKVAAIERIDGSFFNVMGLPIQRVYTELNQFIQSIKNNP